MHELAPEIKSIWALAVFRRTLFLTIVAVLFEIFVQQEHIPNWPLDEYYLSGIIFLLGLTWMFIFPGLAHKHWRFDVREDELFLQRGIFTRVYTTAPYRRVQHLDVAQSILERTFGLGTLVVYTAGTRGADVTIPGLPIAYAEDLRDRLKNITNEDAV